MLIYVLEDYIKFFNMCIVYEIIFLFYIYLQNGDFVYMFVVVKMYSIMFIMDFDEQLIFVCVYFSNNFILGIRLD